jgi:hypothetical protein
MRNNMKRAAEFLPDKSDVKNEEKYET